MPTTKENINAFAKKITRETGVEVNESYESMFGGWCNFTFRELRSNDMIALGNFINKYFKTKGSFTENCFRLVVNPCGHLALVVFENRLNDFMENGKITKA